MEAPVFAFVVGVAEPHSLRFTPVEGRSNGLGSGLETNVDLFCPGGSWEFHGLPIHCLSPRKNDFADVGFNTVEENPKWL